MGQTSSSMETRLKHHSRQPPRRMARDLRLYGHIQRFQVEILAAAHHLTAPLCLVWLLQYLLILWAVNFGSGKELPVRCSDN